MLNRSERNDQHSRKAITNRAFNFIRLLAIVGIALSITAATKTSSSDLSTQSSATTYRKGAAALIFVAIILAVILTLYLAAVSHRVHADDKPILVLATISTPFFVVRIIYLMLVAFAGPTNPTFNFRNPNIWVETFMSYFMEFIIFALFCTAGLLSVSLKGQSGHYENSTGLERGYPKVDGEIGPPMEMGRIPRR
jgi:hypothetical protein